MMSLFKKILIYKLLLLLSRFSRVQLCATHSSVHAWRIPGTGEPGWLPSMGLHRVGHD